MEKILFLSHTQENGQLSGHALETLTAASRMATELGGELAVGLFGEATSEAAKQASGTVLVVEGQAFGQPRYATDAAAAEALVKASAATIVCAPSSSRMSRVLAGVAARVGGEVDTHIAGFSGSNGELVVNRWYYRQRMLGELSRTSRPWFLSIDAGLFERFSGDGAAETQTVSVDVNDSMTRTTVQGRKSPSTGEQTINPDAQVLFVAGAGWTKKQPDGEAHIDKAATLILGFLHQADASLGSSKSLVDLQGEGQQVLPFMTHLNQIGQTGSTPRHPKGLSTCCHGEEPHVVGWRFINERRAINLDANCGWAQGKADVLYVADAFEVMEEVNKLL